MKPEEFSYLGMYGNKDIFQKISKRGYAKVAFGRGGWIEGLRIVAIFAFFHPKKDKVATYQYPKCFLHDGHTMHGLPFSRTYSKKGFAKYLELHKIQFSSKTNLHKILKSWE